MANHKRKRPRSLAGMGSCNDLKREFADDPQGWHWYRSTPSSWNIVFHHRPKRREIKRLEQKILKGEDPDNIAWPMARKPHVYYW